MVQQETRYMNLSPEHVASSTNTGSCNSHNAPQLLRLTDPLFLVSNLLSNSQFIAQTGWVQLSVMTSPWHHGYALRLDKVFLSQSWQSSPRAKESFLQLFPQAEKLYNWSPCVNSVEGPFNVQFFMTYKQISLKLLKSSLAYMPQPYTFILLVLYYYWALKQSSPEDHRAFQPKPLLRRAETQHHVMIWEHSGCWLWSSSRTAARSFGE